MARELPHRHKIVVPYNHEIVLDANPPAAAFLSDAPSLAVFVSDFPSSQAKLEGKRRNRV